MIQAFRAFKTTSGVHDQQMQQACQVSIHNTSRGRFKDGPAR